MSKVFLSLVIHNHQPVGNFDFVFDEAYHRAYKPFIEILKKYPMIKISMHISGPLLEYLEYHHNEYFDDIKNLIKEGRLEILSGGFYEPILGVLPEKAAIGQVKMMNDYIKEKFDYEPMGYWTAERIWEPHLPSVIASTGLKYTMLDDTHFLQVGVTDHFGYYITDHAGFLLSIFPISKKLRYLIPFAPVEELIDFLHSIKRNDRDVAIFMGDDGEKFGVWPGTYKWVYEDGYLEKLFAALSDNYEWLETITLKEFFEKNEPLGRVYPGTSSYREMGEWTLPADKIHLYKEFVEKLKNNGIPEDDQYFVHGGNWRNFFAKYSESNRMHKKSLWVYRRLEEYKSFYPEREKELNDAQKEIFRAQCNCGYWHGIFGGLYLNYLRHAIYYHLIKAETILDKISGSSGHITFYDIDRDGLEEVVIERDDINFYIKPHRGGRICEFDVKDKYFNIMDVLTRRYEEYHSKVNIAVKNIDGEHKSIHEMVRRKEDNLEQFLVYDRYERGSLLDHIFPKDTNYNFLYNGNPPDNDVFVNTKYNTILKTNSIIMKGTGKVPFLNNEVVIEKSIFMGEKSSLQIDYSIGLNSDGIAQFKFATEFNLTLLGTNEDERFFFFKSRGDVPINLLTHDTVKGINEFYLVDRYHEIDIIFSSPRKFDLYRYPIYTVSLSEEGFEKTYQGNALYLIFDIDVPPNDRDEFSLWFEIRRR